MPNQRGARGARGRRRAGGPRTRGARTAPASRYQPAMVGSAGGSKTMVVCRDTEMFIHKPTSGTMGSHEFNPAPNKMVRLEAESKKYLRYRIRSMNISWNPTCSMSTDGVVKMGVVVGKSNSYTADQIVSMRPAIIGPVWQKSTMQLGTEIMIQNHLLSGTPGDNDSVAFTLYVDAPSDKGFIKVTYVVEFSFPIP